jgi:hypothetical protein
VPTAAEPPAVRFTAQVTAVLELPDTVAVNANESPARMFAVVGDTETETDTGVEGVLELPGLELATPPPQPYKKKSEASVANALASGRMTVRHTSNRWWLGNIVGWRELAGLLDEREEEGQRPGRGNSRMPRPKPFITRHIDCDQKRTAQRCTPPKRTDREAPSQPA